MSSFWRDESHASCRMRDPTALLTCLRSNNASFLRVELDVFESWGMGIHVVHSRLSSLASRSRDTFKNHSRGSLQVSTRRRLAISGSGRLPTAVARRSSLEGVSFVLNNTHGLPVYLCTSKCMRWRLSDLTPAVGVVLTTISDPVVNRKPTLT